MSDTAAPRHIDPVLVEGLDQVLLIRLYPDAAGLTDAGAKAVAQGEATGAEGELLESSQYEPIYVAP
jgi:hypothetical protein